MAAAFFSFLLHLHSASFCHYSPHSLIHPRLASMAMCFSSYIIPWPLLPLTFLGYHPPHNTLPLLDHHNYTNILCPFLVFTVDPYPHLNRTNITKLVLLFDLDHGCTSTIY